MHTSTQPRTRRRPNKDAIGALDALDVGQRMGLIEGPNRNNRYRFAGYDGSYWIEFHADGKWTGYKYDSLGGDAAELVMAHFSGAGNDFQPNPQDFPRALDAIATQYNLWIDVDAPRRYSRRIRLQPQPTVYDHLAHIVDAIESKRYPTEPWQQVCMLLDAFEIDPEDITICPYPAGDSGAICWLPVVPWQGCRISKKDKGYGGWTKERALEYAHYNPSLRIIVMDLDGVKGGIKPSVALTDRLIHELAQKDMPIAAHVWSSFDADDSGRAKSHLYFYAQNGARTPREYKRWWNMVARTIVKITETWDIDEAERNALRPDHVTRKISALVRLPGFNKFQSDWAGVVERTPGDLVDFISLWETREIDFEFSGKAYAFRRGPCTVQGEQDGRPYVKTFARDVWPLQIYEDDFGDMGVRLRAHNVMGRTIYRTIPASSWIDTAPGKTAAQHLSNQGVRVSLDSKHLLSYALGAWYSLHQDHAEKVRLTELPGWHGESYLNGHECIGPDQIVADERAEPIVKRSARRGTIEQWQEGGAELINTNGLLTGLGQALAGPLLRLLDRPIFGLHIYGASSSGKSTTSWVASSVWYEKPGDFNKTSKSIDHDAIASNGACLVLDELGQADMDEGELSKFIYNIATGMQRGRLNRDGTAQHRHTWSCTVLTNGELSMERALGEAMKGGHAVRFIDVFIRPGECSRDAQHAVHIKDWARRHHGVVGSAWMQHLLMQDSHDLNSTYQMLCTAMRERFELSPEDGRIVDHLAVTMMALNEARTSGLVYWIDDEQFDEWCKWLIERTLLPRGNRNCPEARAWDTIIETIETDRTRFPTDADDSRDRLWGIIDQTGETFWATRKLLEQKDGPCMRQQITANQFIEWAIAQGYTTGEAKNVRRGKLKRRWIEFTIPDENAQTVPVFHIGTPPVPPESPAQKAALM